MELILVTNDVQLSQKLNKSLTDSVPIKSVVGVFPKIAKHCIVIPVDKRGRISSLSKKDFPDFIGYQPIWKNKIEDDFQYGGRVSVLSVSTEQIDWVIAVNVEHETKEEDNWDTQLNAICSILISRPELSTCYLNLSYFLTSNDEAGQYVEKLLSAFRYALEEPSHYSTDYIWELPEIYSDIAWEGFREIATDNLTKKFPKNSDSWKLYSRILYQEVDKYEKAGIQKFIGFPIHTVLSLQKKFPIYILGGPAIGSMLLYLLGLQPFDPVIFGLSNDLFFNPDRVSIPKFDISCAKSNVEYSVKFIRDLFPEKTVMRVRHSSSKTYNDEILVVTLQHTETMFFRTCFDDKYQIPCIYADKKNLDSQNLHYITIKSSVALHTVEVISSITSKSHFVTNPQGVMESVYYNSIVSKYIKEKVLEHTLGRLKLALGVDEKFDLLFLEMWIENISKLTSWSLAKADLFQRAIKSSIQLLIDEMVQEYIEPLKAKKDGGKIDESEFKEKSERFYEMMRFAPFLDYKYNALSELFLDEWVNMLLENLKKQKD